MKNTIIFSFFIVLICRQSFSQEKSYTKHTFETGIGYSFFGSGDINGIALLNEYTYRFNKFLGIAPPVDFFSKHEKV